MGGAARVGEERRGVLCAGSVVVDLAKVIDAYPAPNRMATIDAVSLSTGGPGLNMAVDLSLLGAPFPVGLLGAVGDDEHGSFVLEECARLGIDTTGLRRVPGVATSFTDCMVERDGGLRTMFHHPGSSNHFEATPADLDGVTARILHTGAPGIHARMDAVRPEAGNGWTDLLAAARVAGMHTNMELVDLPAERTIELVRPCLPLLDSIIINELEAGTLTGSDVTAPDPDGPIDWPALEDMARGLIGIGVSRLAVVHFPAGCVAAAAGGEVWRQGSVAVPRSEIRNTVGAGDAFAAGVLYGVHEERPVDACLRLGVASAAACIRGVSTSDGIRPADECQDEAERLGYRPTAS
jgi:sugar/nucleoside kinase (ribokinase family)